MKKNLQNIQILTPTGFQKFDGVVKKISARTCAITFNDKTCIRCTLDHKFVDNNITVTCSNLRVGDTLNNKQISDITILDEPIEVYDPINVSNGNAYISNGVVSHNCEFLGSGLTLLSGTALNKLTRISPIEYLINNTVRRLVDPVKGHAYVMLVDTARGKELDYSAFVIIDISVMPYQVVCTFKDNAIQTLVFPEVIFRLGNTYNEAFVLIEVNDLGQQVADILFYDLEYENVYMSRGSDTIKEGGGGGATPGYRTTKKTKAIGCNMLKDLIENDKLMVNDSQIIDELTVFVRVGNTYKAEEGKHDDLAMCLVMFGYLVSLPVFQNLFDFNLREQFVADQIREVEEQMLPLGFFDNGLPECTVQKPNANGWVENGEVWNF